MYRRPHRRTAKYLLLFIIGAGLHPACKKTDRNAPTPPFSVTADINGAPTSFKAIITVDSNSTPGTLYIVAHSDSANLTPLFEITLTGSRPLKADTYFSTDSANISLIGYTAWQGDTSIQYSSVSDTVVLNTVNRTWLSGTFSGTCAYSSDSILTVTNGQFAVGWNER